MIVLRDAIEIDASPELIFEWLGDLDKNYRAWHQDHVCWEFQDGFREGSTCRCEELMHGRVHRMKGRITRLRANRLVEFRFAFPTSLVCPGGSFMVEPRGQGSVFVATLSFRLGGLFSRLARGRVDAVRNHMREEGENLKRILEGAVVGASGTR